MSPEVTLELARIKAETSVSSGERIRPVASRQARTQKSIRGFAGALMISIGLWISGGSGPAMNAH